MLEEWSLTGSEEMDLPAEPFPLCFNRRMCLLLHAAKEGARELETVSTRMIGTMVAHSVRKVAAIDFFGAFLALAGSTLLVVCSSTLAAMRMLTKQARFDMGWQRVRLALGSCYCNTGSRRCRLSVVHHLAMERH
jgi:hypothetical protein